MNAITKNKEEIEKINEGCGTWNDKKIIKYCGQLKKVIWLCPTCKKVKQERIKTSILWCEAWLEVTTSQPLRVLLKAHLTYLKEQEKQ